MDKRAREAGARDDEEGRGEHAGSRGGGREAPHPEEAKAAAQPRQLRIRRGRLEDLPAVMRIEQASFPSPWPEQAIAEELQGRPGSLFLIAELEGEIVGYVGAWLYAGETHICTLAVAPAHRRQGLGEILMLSMLAAAQAQSCRYVILEYRVSNFRAAALYEKLGFAYAYRRRGYYPDNREDAIVAVIPDLAAPAQQRRLQQLWEQWQARHGYILSLEI